jgi:Holliday junction resolvase RusA-like endonuclease
MVSFTVYIEPVAKARPRVTMRNGRAFAYTPKKSADYEAVIAGHCPNEPIEGPLALNLHFGIRIPTSWSKRKKADAVSGFIRPTSRPDIDNYIKAVMDAVNGQAYHDDSQVVSLAASLSYTDSPYVSFKASPV